MTTADTIKERFQHWKKLIETVQTITSGEFVIQCNDGRATDAFACWKMGRITYSQALPRDYNKEVDINKAFSDLVSRIEKAKVTGEASITALSFFGKIYKVKIGVKAQYVAL